MNHFQEALQFGKYAIEIGVLSQEQLTWALDQATQVGKERLVSDVLLDAGLLSVEDLEKVLRAIADGERGAANGNGSNGHHSNGNGTPPPAPGAVAPASSAAGPAPEPTSGAFGPGPAAGPTPDLSGLGPGTEEPQPVVVEPASPDFETASTERTDESPIEIAAAGEAATTPAPEAMAPDDDMGEPGPETADLFAAPTFAEAAPGSDPAGQAPPAAPAVEPSTAAVADPAPPSVTERVAAAPAPAAAPVESAGEPPPSGVEEVVDAPSPAERGERPCEQTSLVLGWLEAAAAEGASDLHLHVGEVERTRVHGFFPKKAEGEAVSGTETAAFLRWVLTPAEWQALEDSGQIDFSYTLPGKVRLRCNAYRQQSGTDVVFRLIPWAPPSLEQLGLPETLSRFADYHQGMVLFTGPSSCGKSSTLAAIVRLVNEQRAHHILTVEDPIEFLHASEKANVNQRQVGRHTGSFARALKAALREDPDVIVIGELRDLETIRLALTAAETGHLVLGTMHTRNAVGTINRLIGSFPPEEQAQIRTMVSESLRGIVSQRLAQKSDGTGQVAALEVLIATNAVSNLVRESKTFQIPSILQSGASLGMCLMDASLNQLLKSGQIDRDEALRLCENPKSFGG